MKATPGGRTRSGWQRLFWLLVLAGSAGFSLWLMQENISNFNSYTTKINIEDRSADLQETFFPSVTVCNINPLRKSFIYWIHENLQDIGWTNVSITTLFELIGKEFFNTDNETITSESEELLNFILDSKFYQEYFEEFMGTMKTEKGTGISITPVHFFHQLTELEEELGPYSAETRRVYHANFLSELAGQWHPGQMVSSIKELPSNTSCFFYPKE